MVKNIPENILGISYAKRALEAGSREQRRMQTYAEQLSAYTLVVLTRKRDQLPESVVIGNLTILGTNTHTRLGMLCQAFWLGRRVLKQNKGQWLITSQDPFVTALPVIVLSTLFRVPYHVQLHGDQFGNPQWVNDSLRKKLQSRFGLWVLKRAVGVRVVSARAALALSKLGLSKDKITILPIRPKLEPFLQVGKLRTEYKGPGRFLYVGRLSPEKNIDRILRVFAAAYRQAPEISLTILGSGPLEKDLKQQVVNEKIAGVTFIPWTNDVASVLTSHDVLILASAHEGYAMVVVEAMAAGLAIISTDVGCVGEVMKNNEHGRVVPFDKDDVFVQSILSMENDVNQRIKFSKNAYRSVEDSATDESTYLKAWKASFSF